MKMKETMYICNQLLTYIMHDMLNKKQQFYCEIKKKRIQAVQVNCSLISESPNEKDL